MSAFMPLRVCHAGLSQVLRRTTRLLPWFLSIAGVLTFAPKANAYDYCVDKVGDGIYGSNTTGLLNALLHAEGAPNDSTNTIRIVQGAYTLLDSSFYYDAPGRQSLRILGGYVPGTSCGSRDLEPANTTIALTNGAHLNIGIGEIGENGLVVEGIKFLGGYLALGQDSDGDDGGRVVARFNQFVDSGMTASSPGKGPGVFDNLYLRSALRVLASGSSPGHVAFNTVVPGAYECDPIYLKQNAPVQLASEAAGSVFHHNIVAPSVCPAEIEVKGVDASSSYTDWIAHANMYEQELASPESADLLGTGNITGAQAQIPGFAQPATENFHLQTSPKSAAVNAGLTESDLSLVLGLSGLEAPPATDLDGASRLRGLRYDMGAYESSLTGAEVLTVTKSTDDDCVVADQDCVGTLRWAIGQANSLAGTSVIEFDIPAGACPATITLADGVELPPITDDVVIDGYTQACAQINESPEAFTGTPGVALFEPIGGATLDYGLQIASSTASLTVRGMAFTAPVSAVVALDLLEGSGHGVFGNVFEGGVGAVRGIRVATAGTVDIGGPEPAQRNVFGSFATPLQGGRAILVNHPQATTTIENNLIGMTPAGNAARPVDSGIFVQAGDAVLIRNNVISSARQAIQLSGADAKDVKIYANRLGTQAAVLAAPLASMVNGVGILVSDGSGGHRVGLGVSGAAANWITNGGGAGISLEASAGSGTRIARNTIYGNGAISGALQIDLGDVGQQQNDSFDADPGPNDLQNFPVITGSAPLGNGKWQVTGTLSGDDVPHTIEIYRSTACPGQRADMRTFIGQVTNVTPVAQVFPPAPPVASFTAEVPSTGGAPGFLTAVATQNAIGSTGEPGPCFAELQVVNQPPKIEADQTFTVLEIANLGDEIGQVQASDDGIPQDSLTFSIVGGDPEGLFAIHQQSGILIRSDLGMLDAAATPSITLTIGVSDGELDATEPVTVNVVASTLLCDGFEDFPTPCEEGFQ